MRVRRPSSGGSAVRRLLCASSRCRLVSRLISAGRLASWQSVMSLRAHAGVRKQAAGEGAGWAGGGVFVGVKPLHALTGHSPSGHTGGRSARSSPTECRVKSADRLINMLDANGSISGGCARSRLLRLFSGGKGT